MYSKKVWGRRNVELKHTEWAAIKKKAKAEGKTIKQYIRDVILEDLERRRS